MIPLAEPNLSGNEAMYLQECIETNFVSSVGPFVDRFETLVSKAAGTDTAVAVNSGTSGLHAALVSVGVSRDDLVVIPDYTFIATANAVAMAGATPWIFDINDESWTLDPVDLATTFDREVELRGNAAWHVPTNRRVAAIIPVHTFGHPANLKLIVEIAQRYGIPVVADGAAALAATCHGQTVGGSGADLTVFSFNGNKTVTAGACGAVTGNDPNLLARVRHLTTTARTSMAYTHDRVAFNYRMTNLQAAVGCAQMEQLHDFVASKRLIRDRYTGAFANLSCATSPPNAVWANSACWISGVCVDDNAEVSAQAIAAHLRENGIDARLFWQPVHHQAPFADAPRQSVGTSEQLAKRFIALPCSSNLLPNQQNRVIEACIELLRAEVAIAPFLR